MDITLVLAMDDDGLIGAAGGLPWRMPADLRHFRELTMGRTIVMGRTTWQSIGRPLDGRDNWVLSRDPSFEADGARVFTDIDSLLAAAPTSGLAVIGGARVYEQLMPKATRIELTRIHARLKGDAYFPDPALEGWRTTDLVVHQPDSRHAWPYSFQTLVPR
ncbi:dihydrofolate reductase [Algiphilus aromaticivorans]|uniref:dihydrofolate reductase n=1 Tax=Algiphilus aromaticivorans TaxID=382454 RepID=UPI0005C14471|nr:dihydrofolate reductase [Algiphilus aromaticivorans]